MKYKHFKQALLFKVGSVLHYENITCKMFFVCMFACLFVNFSKLAKLAKSINLVKFKKLMLLFTRLFVYLQYKNIIIIVTIVVFSNLKGGVGKNTLCCYFAHFLVAKNSVTIQRL